MTVRVSTILAILIGLLVTSRRASAEIVPNLYTADAFVTGQIEPERSRGFREGVRDVIVKLTGDARLADDPRIAPLLADPAALIESFEYEDRMKDLPIKDEQGTRERPYFLHMRFKPDAVDRALAGLGVKTWGADRPLTRVKVQIGLGATRHCLTDSGPDGYGQRLAVIETAKRRGVPIILPRAKAGRAARATTCGETFWPDENTVLESNAFVAEGELYGTLTLTNAGTWNVEWTVPRLGATRDWGPRAQLEWGLRGVSFDAAFRNGIETAAAVFSGNQPE